MAALRHLRHLLRGRWFRRLLTVRLASQLGDGVLQVALASYALFGQEQTDPGEIAVALAVVLLPFSLLGPFAGVFLDRWSRRQVLVWANLSRVALGLLLAAVVAAELSDAVFYGVTLVCLSVNRFLLAGLSAALPHTVADEDLLTANAVTPTTGTLAFLVGLGGGGTLAVLTGAGDVAVLSAAALLYGVAGLLALRLPRDLLGPDPAAGVPPALTDSVRHVVVGMVDGLRHLRAHRDPAAGLAVIAGQRYLFGLTTVLLFLLYRNTFHPGDADAAFAALGQATLVGGAGFVTAAVVTPVVTEHLDPRSWVVLLLVGAGLVQLVPAATLEQGPLLVAAFLVGLAAQGIKICVDTFVQRDVDDVFRGRVFSVYDVLFNVAFVAAAASAVFVLPEDGRSPTTLVVVAVGYLALAAAFVVMRRPARDGRPTRSRPSTDDSTRPGTAVRRAR
jgi:MFS family permease